MEASATMEQLEARWASSERSPRDDGAVAILVWRGRRKLMRAIDSTFALPGEQSAT